MKSVTVTELLDWAHCRTLWDFRHVQRLQPMNKSPNMVSGSVVHKTIADVLSGAVERRFIELAAFNGLMDEFNSDQTLVDRYLPGVNRALSKVPEWVWGSTWHSEERLTMLFPNGIGLKAMRDIRDNSMVIVEDMIELRGRPDLFLVTDDVLDIVEFKTTDNVPLDYLLWNPQHRYYAVMLDSMYPGRVIRFRYVCLSTQGKKVVDNMPWVFGSRQLAQSKIELEQAVHEVGSITVYPNYSRACDFCDFKVICTAVLTGASTDGIIEEEFIHKSV